MMLAVGRRPDQSESVLQGGEWWGSKVRTFFLLFMGVQVLRLVSRRVAPTQGALGSCTFLQTLTHTDTHISLLRKSLCAVLVVT